MRGALLLPLQSPSSQEAPLLRSFEDEATGWHVEEYEADDGARRQASLEDPTTGHQYRRIYHPEEPTHQIPVSAWVGMVRLGATLPLRSHEPHMRRAQRVLAMVHELHKVGFQKLRIAPFMAPSGAAWRCTIMPFSHTSRRHGAVDVGYVGAPQYTSASGNEYFGWSDARSDSARELARRFLERYPHVAFAARGDDWAYTGWYVEMLGRAEAGDLPAVFSDGWGPAYDHVPTTGDSVLPMPPPGGAED